MTFHRKKPRPLKDLLDDFIENYPDKTAIKRGMVLALWPELVGESVRGQVRDLKFQGSRLILFVADPSWRHEIHMQRHNIARKLNEAVKGEIVREIIIKN